MQLRAQLIATRSVGIAAAEEAAALQATARGREERQRRAETQLEERNLQLEKWSRQLEEVRAELEGRVEAATELASRLRAQLDVETARRGAAEAKLEQLGAARREQEVALLPIMALLGSTYHGSTLHWLSRPSPAHYWCYTCHGYTY